MLNLRSDPSALLETKDKWSKVLVSEMSSEESGGEDGDVIVVSRELL